MALDTREKRANVVGVGRPWLRSKDPSSDKDEQWRASSANSYGGNPLSPVIPGGAKFDRVGIGIGIGIKL